MLGGHGLAGVECGGGQVGGCGVRARSAVGGRASQGVAGFVGRVRGVPGEPGAHSIVGRVAVQGGQEPFPCGCVRRVGGRCELFARVVVGVGAAKRTVAAGDVATPGTASRHSAGIEFAERTLASAVIYERERGSSWSEIAQYLGIGPAEARERFATDLEGWNTAFDVPYRLDETGRKRVPQLPTAAYDPAWACEKLDRWAYLQRIGIDAVSSGLVMAAPEEESPPVTP